MSVGVPPVGRPPTMKEIAATAGVGLATVSRALSGSNHVAEDTRLRVEAAVKELGYRPSALGRGLKRQRTDTIGLLVADIANEFYGEFARGVLEAARARAKRVIVGSSGEDADAEHENLELLLEQRVDGIIAFPTHRNPESWTAALGLGVRLVFADRTIDGFDVPSVVVDNREGTRRLAAHLLGLGHRRIGYLGGPREVTSGLHREEGFRDAMAAAGVPVDERLVVRHRFTRETAGDAADRLLQTSERPSAIIASNNVLGEAALGAIRRAGYRMPSDISFAMVDDPPWASLTTPAITTLALPASELGRAAVELVLSDAPAPSTVLPTRLVLRESAVPPAAP